MGWLKFIFLSFPFLSCHHPYYHHPHHHYHHHYHHLHLYLYLQLHLYLYHLLSLALLSFFSQERLRRVLFKNFFGIVSLSFSSCHHGHHLIIIIPSHLIIISTPSPSSFLCNQQRFTPLTTSKTSEGFRPL